jgi:drug/metabolite transporter (DMT)-like permease
VSATDPSKDPPRPRILVALACVYLIWSSTYYAIRVVVQEAPPFGTAAARYLLAGVLLMGLARLSGLPWPRPRQWRDTALLGTLLFGVGNGFVSFASQELGSGIVAIVCATMPLAGAALSPLFGTLPSPRELVGLGLGFVAVALLASGGDLRAASPVALLLLFLAPLGWALGSLLVRRLDVGPPMMASAAQMLGGGLVLLAVAASRGEAVPRALTGEATAMFAHLVVSGSLVGFLAYQYLLVHARPALAMSYAYVNPVLAVLLGTIFGGEPVSIRAVGALALISAAVFVTVTKPPPRPAPIGDPDQRRSVRPS